MHLWILFVKASIGEVNHFFILVFGKETHVNVTNNALYALTKRKLPHGHQRFLGGGRVRKGESQRWLWRVLRHPKGVIAEGAFQVFVMK